MKKFLNVHAICRNSTCDFEYSELEDYLPFGRPRAKRVRYPAVVLLEGPVVIPVAPLEPWEPTVNPPQHFALRIDAF